MKVLPSPGADSTVERAAVALDDPVRDAEPKPGALPSGLVVKNGSKTRRATSGGMPAPSSRTETTTRGPAGRAAGGRSGFARRIVPPLADGVDGVGQHVEQHLVELAGHALDRRHLAVVALDRDAAVEAVAQQGERALEALAHVDPAPNAPSRSARANARKRGDDLRRAARALLAVVARRCGQVVEQLVDAQARRRAASSRSRLRRQRRRA